MFAENTRAGKLCVRVVCSTLHFSIECEDDWGEFHLLWDHDGFDQDQVDQRAASLSLVLVSALCLFHCAFFPKSRVVPRFVTLLSSMWLNDEVLLLVVLLLCWSGRKAVIFTKQHPVLPCHLATALVAAFAFDIIRVPQTLL